MNVLFRRFMLLMCTLAFCCPVSLFAHDETDGGKGFGGSSKPGIGNFGPWQSRNITLVGRMTLEEMGAPESGVLGNDIWGWTDSLTGREYALFGMSNATSIVDITDGANPVYMGKINSHTGNQVWRDIKVYNNHAYIVADLNDAHGMQIFDLTTLRGMSGPPNNNIAPTAHFAGFDRAHNIAINEDSGFAYIAGSEVAGGGIRALDLSNPTAPVFAGDFSSDGYTHDTQVVNYVGPDADYAGHEIAFNLNADTLTIVDVTDKTNMTQIARESYEGVHYAHQGWLSEDQKYFFSNDELDERDDPNVTNTLTKVWNVEDLDNPFILNTYVGVADTIDHNLYTHNGYIYQANYSSGVRVLEAVDAENGIYEEFGFFDTYGTDNNVSFNGAWSVFPYFDSGYFIVSDRQNGLFILRLNTIPEPGTITFVMLGLAGLGLSRRRRR